MTYIVGVVLVGVMFGAAAWSALGIRRSLLPGWSGPPAWTADMVIWAAEMTAIPAVLGAFTLFNRAGLTIGVVVVAAILRSIAARVRAPAERPVVEATNRREGLAAAAISAVLMGPWLLFTLQAYKYGQMSYDTLNYHQPFAARWALTGSTWHIQNVYPGIASFIVPYHPLSAEILHGVGMVAFHSDVLSPLLNLFWIALIGVAAWSIGAPKGRGPQALALALIASNCPLLISSQPASAMTDLAVIGVCLAAVAFLVQGVSFRSVAVVSGVTLGLACGVKLNALPIVAALFIGIIVLAPAADRLAVGIRVLVSAIVVGGFWYLRDFVAVGNPIPSLKLPLFPAVGSNADRADDFSVLHYIAKVHIIRHYFFPGLRLDFGNWWPLWGLAAAVALVLAVVKAPSAAFRVGAIVAVVAVLSYVVTPTTAFGPPNQPILFVLNLRYGMMGFVMAVALLPTAVRGTRWPLVLAGLGALAVLASPNAWPLAPHVASRGIGLGISLVAAVAVLVIPLRSRALIPAGVLVAVACGAYIQHKWIPHQYANIPQDTPALAWGRSLHHARIAFLGLSYSYPLSGTDLTNYVQYLGVTPPHHGFDNPPTCAALRTAFDKGHYTYIVFANSASSGPAPSIDSWVQGAPGVVPVLTTHSATAYRITRPLDPGTCAT